MAPSTHQPIVRQSRESGGRELILARWGLIPFFSKNLSEVKGLITINARAETITTSRTWREPVKKRRCLVPVSAFYEWPKDGKPLKQPYAFEMANGKHVRVCRPLGGLAIHAAVGNVKDDGPEMLRAVERAAEEGSIPL